jgi:hypothetical protein
LDQNNMNNFIINKESSKKIKTSWVYLYHKYIWFNLLFSKKWQYLLVQYIAGTHAVQYISITLHT